MAFADPPYNVPVAGFVTSSARLAHRAFAMAVGEMSEDEFIAFLRSAMACASRFSVPGAVQFWCQDWRHQFELLSAARLAGLEQLNTCVWVKDNGGMGGLYRSRHEFVGVFKVPGAAHRNNVELGKHGRNRTNVWDISRRGDVLKVERGGTTERAAPDGEAGRPYCRRPARLLGKGRHCTRSLSRQRVDPDGGGADGPHLSWH